MVDFGYVRQVRKAAAHRLYDISDGDTPNIVQPVRMVSIDTPEKSGYAGLPEVAQPKLDTCRQRLLDGVYPAIPDGLRTYLVDRLDAGAAAPHIDAREVATPPVDQ